MVEIKTPGEIEAVRAAGQVVAQALAAVRDAALPGTRLADLDEVARSRLAAAGAGSPFLGYQPRFVPVPFPAVICASVNDAALHGIPGRYRLAEGDLLSVDCGAVLDGWAADAMPAELGADPVARGAPDRADGGGDVPDPGTRHRHGDTRAQRRLGGRDQPRPARMPPGPAAHEWRRAVRGVAAPNTESLIPHCGNSA